MSEEKKVYRSLTKMEQFQLMSFIQTDYVKSELGDGAFAALATEKLNFLVTRQQIIRVRQGFKIDGNASRERKGANNALLERLVKMEDLLADLDLKVTTLQRSVRFLTTSSIGKP